MKNLKLREANILKKLIEPIKKNPIQIKSLLLDGNILFQNYGMNLIVVITMLSHLFLMPGMMKTTKKSFLSQRKLFKILYYKQLRTRLRRQ